MSELRSQHQDYLLKGIMIGVSNNLLESEYQEKVVTQLLPKLIEAINIDLNRFNFRNLINVLSSF